MPKSISSLLFILFFFTSFSYAQKSSLHGKILDSDENQLSGASVIIIGTSLGVNVNEKGEYLFTEVPSGKITLRASFMGYESKTVYLEIQTGQNQLDLTLEHNAVQLDAVTVTSQKREQQIIDVPISMTVINAKFIEDNNITELDKLSEYVPGLQIRMQGSDRPSFVIRGLTSDEVSPAAQPRVSIFYNNVPISRANGSAVEIFDMQQIDVLKGPQGTLFGRGSQIGAINYMSKKPVNDYGGYFTIGIGNFNQKELNAAINTPIIKDKLLLRIAGIYDYQDGYIKNTFGGNLNGKNSKAARLSFSYLPTATNKIDVVMNYQKDDNPGLGFMSMSYPNTEGSKNPFDYVASLEQGNKLANNRDIFDATLTIKHSINKNNYLTSISSYRNISTYSRWDGDGTAAAAIDMSEDDGAKQFFQELRFNYSIKSKITGSIGGSFWTEKASQNFWFSPNEQNMVHLFLNTGYLVLPNGQPFPMTNLPLDPRLGPIAGSPLGTNHQEENKNIASNLSLEGFADANYQLTDKLSITAGIRLINDWIDLTNQSQMSGGSPSTLGYLSGFYPNLFFKPVKEKDINTTTMAFTYRGGLKYSFSENSMLFAGYAKGRRPKVLQFTSAGEKQIIDAETVNSFDLGYKTVIKQRLWFDIGAYYYSYLDFQTSAWIANSGTGQFNYILKDGGKASAYGVEINVKYAILSGIQIFGNYAFIHARFADNDVDGIKQEYASHMFRLTPEHSFAIGLNARTEIAKDLFLFATPSYSYKTKIFFEDANTTNIEQKAYGLLNLRAGIEYKHFTLSFWGSNLLAEEFIVSAGNSGSLFGDPTQIPGAPRMFGSKICWKF
ncbi:MAG: TonB-dependent receptor [Bacteroidales bacterium]